MAGKRSAPTTEVKGGESKMSTFEVEALSQEEWNEAGAASTNRGAYRSVLESFANAGIRFARIPAEQLEGRKTASVVTALKQALDSKDAPDAFEHIKISSKKGAVYLLNEAVTA